MGGKEGDWKRPGPIEPTPTLQGTVTRTSLRRLWREAVPNYLGTSTSQYSFGGKDPGSYCGKAKRVYPEVSGTAPMLREKAEWPRLGRTEVAAAQGLQQQEAGSLVPAHLSCTSTAWLLHKAALCSHRNTSLPDRGSLRLVSSKLACLLQAPVSRFQRGAVVGHGGGSPIGLA